MKNYRIPLSLFFLFSIYTSLFSQNGGYLSFLCRVNNAELVPMKDVKVTLFNKTEQIATLKTRKNGQFSFNIFLDDEYKITFSKPGYIDIYLMIYATTASGEVYPENKTEVTLYADTTPGINAQKFKEPLMKLIYDGQDHFIRDSEYDVYLKSIPDFITSPQANRDSTAATKTNTLDTTTVTKPVQVDVPIIKTATTDTTVKTTIAVDLKQYSKNNYPEKFAFADTDKDNSISLMEVNSAIKGAKPETKEVTNELIDWFFE